MRDEVSHRCHTALRKVARPTGFEPVAFGSGGRRSIQLSYGRIECEQFSLAYRASSGVLPAPVQDRGWLYEASPVACPAGPCLAVPACFHAAADSVVRTPTNTWFTNGMVHGVATRGNVVYLAGDFSRIGQKTGMFAILDRVSGQPDLTAPRIEGATNDDFLSAIVADGRGGYYVAGAFARAGGVPRNGIVHLTAEGDIDPAFIPPAFWPQWETTKLALVWNRLFATVWLQSQTQVVALDALTGAQVPFTTTEQFNLRPRLFSGPNNSLLAADGTTLRSIDATTGALRWSTPAQVAAVDGQTAVISSALGLYRVDLTSGTTTTLAIATGAGTCFPASPWQCRMRLVTLFQNRVYVIGPFEAVGDHPRNGSAAIDLASGTVLPWTAPILTDFSLGITGMWGDGVRVLVGYGRGVAGHALVALDPITGVQTGWRAYLLGVGPLDLIAEPSRLVVVGGFWGAGGVARAGLVAVNWPDGSPTAWSPTLPLDGVRAIALSGSRLLPLPVEACTSSTPTAETAACSAKRRTARLKSFTWRAIAYTSAVASRMRLRSALRPRRARCESVGAASRKLGATR
jgi:hypothetical protein